MITMQQASPVRSQRTITIARRVLQSVRANAEPNRAAPPAGPFSLRRPEGTLKATIPWSPGSKKAGIPPALKSGAMVFYTNQVRMPKASGKGVGRRTGTMIWGALAVSLAYPDLEQVPNPSKHKRKVYRKVLAEISELWTERGISSMVSVKKMDDHFAVKVPVYFGSEGVLSGMRDFYKPDAVAAPVEESFAPIDQTRISEPVQRAPDALEAAFKLREGVYQVSELPKTGGAFDRYHAFFRQAPGAHIEVKLVGNAYVFLLCLNFSQQEATVMCQSNWLTIRAIDFYSLMRAWADGRCGGVRGDPPIYSLPLSRIARELPEGAPTRLSKDLGILVDEKSEYWWIQDSNEIASFEQEYTKHLGRPDGSLSAAPLDISDQVDKPPQSGLVFVDWVNLKLSFVNGAGKMEVVGLDRSVPANITHYVRVLRTKLSSKMGLGIISQTYNMASFTGFAVGHSKGAAGLLTALLALDKFEGQQESDLTIQDAYDNRHLVPEADELFKAIDHVLSYADSSVKNLYGVYAYRTVSSLIAYLKIIQAHAPKYETAAAEDKQRRDAYINQDTLDPNYSLEAVPYMNTASKDGPNGIRALMPHQFRNAKRLARSPNFAILAVDAGGGKTASCVMDFLKELGKGNVRRGLIMCPAHLVAQYVKEFLYFTNGRVNIIAVNTYTLKHHTLAGMAKMLESAPPNTVVVTDYGLAQGASKSPAMGYGAATTKYYPVVEMLRSFMFDYVFCDESHFLKSTSQRQSAVARLISDIPYKRLASGTLAPNAVTDLLQQVALLDPTVFPKEEFLEKYALEVKGGKVTKWKPGYEAEMMAELKQHVVWCQTKRKEWASLLPDLMEVTHLVELTDNQQRVYNTILNEVVLEIQRAMSESNAVGKALQKLMTGHGDDDEVPADGEEADEDAEEADPIDIDTLLRPYLARLEKFVSSPGSDILGATMLQGRDLMSPKVDKITEIIRDHIASGLNGKILIFTNLVESAEAIYNGLPDDLRQRTIAYKASNKAECGAEFEGNPDKLIMVGVEVSMNTGLNLQFCFTADTPVLVDRKTSLPIKDIFDNDAITEVLAYDLETKKIGTRKILRKIRTKVRAKDHFVSVSVFDPKLGYASAVKCTDNHHFFLKGGAEVAAKDLKVGDQLITYGRAIEQKKIDADGTLIPRKQMLRRACPHCSEIFRPGPGLTKHLATAHAVGVEKYANYKQTQAIHTQEHFADDTYRELHQQKMKAIANSPEGLAQRAASTRVRWAKPGARQEQSIKASARWADAAYKKSVGAAIAAAFSSTEARAAMSQRSKAMWKDAAYQELIAKRRAAYWSDPANRDARSAVSKKIWTQKEEDGSATEWREAISTGHLQPATTALKRADMIRRHATLPGYTAKSIGAMLKAQGTLPNKPERNVIDLGIPGLKYVGDGQYFITLEMDGKQKVKCPDFISTEHVSKTGRSLKVVEVIGAREHTGRDSAYDRKLVKAYAKAGIECLIINAEACYLAEDLEKVHSRLDSFINNHYLTVQAVIALKSDTVIGDYKYDLEIEGTHNFFVGATYQPDASRLIPILAHNCSRLIRADSVWTPGALEQGDSRIQRPNVKNAETRTKVYVDWVIAERTIDITKSCYLRQKKVTIGKFEEAGNPRFTDIENPPAFSMTLDTIRHSSDSTGEELAPYQSAYKQFKEATFREYEDYKRKNQQDLDPVTGALRMIPIDRAANQPSAALMYRVPYVPGTELYKTEDLGLIRYDAYMRLNEADLLDDDTPEVETEGQRAISRAELAQVQGLAVHTEYGDGNIVAVGKRNLGVELTSGERVNVNKLTAFVINRGQTTGKDMRELLLRQIGDVDFKKPLELEVKDAQSVKIPKRRDIEVEEEADDRIAVSLNITVTNDLIGLEMDNASANPEGAAALEAFGFKQPAPYLYAEMKTPQQMYKQMVVWTKAGFYFDKSSSAAMRALYENLLVARKNAATLIGQATAADLRNFYRLNTKADPDRKRLYPYPLIENDTLFIALPLSGHPASKAALTHKAPGVRWYSTEATVKDMRAVYMPNLGALDRGIAKMLSQGIVITNLKDLQKTRKRLHKRAALLSGE